MPNRYVVFPPEDSASWHKEEYSSKKPCLYFLHGDIWRAHDGSDPISGRPILIAEISHLSFTKSLGDVVIEVILYRILPATLWKVDILSSNGSHITQEREFSTEIEALRSTSAQYS